MASIKKRVTVRVVDGREVQTVRFRARYRDPAGKEHSRNFAREKDARKWLDDVTATIVAGTHVDPRTARTTVGDWCDVWLAGYRSRRPRTVRQAEVHLARIRAAFGDVPLADVRPSHVKSWIVALRAEGLADSYVFALHSRLAQLYSDAIHDGIVPRSPCSRRTSPGQGEAIAYVATTEQVWALHDAMPARTRVAVLLGGMAGLRLGEVCGLRVSDVDFMRGVVHPQVQWPAEPLKTKVSKAPVPVPASMALLLAEHVRRHPNSGGWFLANEWGDQLTPWALQVPFRAARAKVPGLPEGFRFHDLRHYYASALIAEGLDVKEVQSRLRHASGKTTIDVYGKLWPGKDESTRAAIEGLFAGRMDSDAADLAGDLGLPPT